MNTTERCKNKMTKAESEDKKWCGQYSEKEAIEGKFFEDYSVLPIY